MGKVISEVYIALSNIYQELAVLSLINQKKCNTNASPGDKANLFRPAPVGGFHCSQARENGA